MNYSIAFVGFGEAAYFISKGLFSEGVRKIIAFDTAQEDKVKGSLIHKRAEEAGVTLGGSLEDTVSSAGYVVALTSAAAAVATAREVLPYLKTGQVYVDMNSCGPSVLTEIEEIEREDGVLICDAAILNSVPSFGHKVKMYLAGEGASCFYNEFVKFGMNLTLLDAPAGGASAIKMMKSVFTKGLPQLMLETMLPAAKYGVLPELVKNIKNTFKEKDVEEYAEAYLCKTLIHAKRRGSEVGDVIKTVESLGMDASMSIATKKKLEELAKFHYMDRLGADAVFGYNEAIELILDDYKKLGGV